MSTVLDFENLMGHLQEAGKIMGRMTPIQVEQWTVYLFEEIESTAKRTASEAFSKEQLIQAGIRALKEWDNEESW